MCPTYATGGGLSHGTMLQIVSKNGGRPNSEKRCYFFANRFFWLPLMYLRFASCPKLFDNVG